MEEAHIPSNPSIGNKWTLNDDDDEEEEEANHSCSTLVALLVAQIEDALCHSFLLLSIIQVQFCNLLLDLDLDTGDLQSQAFITAASVRNNKGNTTMSLSLSLIYR